MESSSAISTVNWSEALVRLLRGGVPAEAAEDVLGAHRTKYDLEVVSFDERLALAAARLSLITRPRGLSFADRACLALARQLGAPAVTADKSWLEVDAGVSVELIR
jgi:PIN domain nuclease of toxin-antitoxin system